MPTTLLILALAIARGGALVWLARLRRSELGALRADSAAPFAERNADVDLRLRGVVETMDRRLAELDTKVDRRLATAAETTNRIHDRLGKANEATAQMLERVKDLSRLEHALRPPKARAGFGELPLENLLRDRLPPGAYTMQHGFRSGERVDAVVHAGQPAPVDAKFPLDNYARMVEAEGDDERQLHERAFARDVKGHGDAIATTYIRPDEGTYDFALMYVPAAAVYYELTCAKTCSLLRYAHEKRVFPVSPTTFTSQLQVIALGLKGLQIEQHAQEGMAYVADLHRDFERFKADFEVVGKHLGNAHTKYVEAEKRLDRFDGKLERASEQDSVELEAEAEPTELPRALDAA